MKKKNRRAQTKRPGDFFYYEAKEQGYLARSVFKLEEIDKKYGLFPPLRKEPFFIIDLGCAPGSWLQYVCTKLDVKDKVVGIDINPITISDPKIIFIQKDINDVSPDELFKAAKTQGFDLVLSDMAPKTTGIKISDQQRSIDLCESAFELSKKTLKKNGVFVIKVFQSNLVKPFIEKIKKTFSEVKIFKPESSRKESFEIYIVAKVFLPSSREEVC